MKRLRAILLLVVYFSFTASTALAAHVCSGNCVQGIAGHADFGDPGTVPTECAEKEVFNNQTTEHRTVLSIRLFSSNLDKKITYVSRSNTAVTAFNADPSLTTPFKVVPFYITHCAYRL